MQPKKEMPEEELPSFAPQLYQPLKTKKNELLAMNADPATLSTTMKTVDSDLTNPDNGGRVRSSRTVRRSMSSTGSL